MFKLQLKNGRIVKFEVANGTNERGQLVKRLGSLYNKELAQGSLLGYSFDLQDGEYLMACKICTLSGFLGCKLYSAV